MGPLLKVENLDVMIQKNHLFTRCSFELDVGQSMAIIGVSGSGKTTCANCLMGFCFDPHIKVSGKIYWRNNELLHNGPHSWDQLRGREICLISQKGGAVFNPLWSVKKHFFILLQHHFPQLTSNEKEAFCLERLEEVKLDFSFLSYYPHQLSGGIKQRVLLALAISLSPSLLILDEPTAGLDNHNAEIIISLLQKQLQEKNISLIFITHNPLWALKMGGKDRGGRLLDIAAFRP